MSGYFARLIARTRPQAPRVRPQTALPFAERPHVDDVEGPVLVEDRAAAEAGGSGAAAAADANAVAGAAANEVAVRDGRSPTNAQPRRDAMIEAEPPPVARGSTGGRAHAADDSRAAAPRAPAAHDPAGRRMPAAANAGARRGDALRPAARAGARRDEAAPRSDDADFRLIPESPDPLSTRRPALAGGGEGAAFARALEEARAQIQRQLAAGGSAPSEVHVSIGRIEVTAAQTPAPPPRKATERASAPAVSLEQYLANRARRRP